MMKELDSRATDLLTSDIIRTVGRVVEMFCGCGGRIVTGTTPDSKSIAHVLNTELVPLRFTQIFDNSIHTYMNKDNISHVAVELVIHKFMNESVRSLDSKMNWM